ADLLAPHLHLGGGQAGLPAVGHALVVGTERHRVTALELEPQLTVAFANFRGLLADLGPEHGVVAALSGRPEARRVAEDRAIDVEGESRAHEDGALVANHVVTELL